MSFTQNPRSDFTTTNPTSEHHQHQRVRAMPEHTKDEAGVIEAYPGIIESTDIDPLHHELNKGSGTNTPKSKQGYMAAATDMAASAAKYVYSTATGDEAGKKAGKEGLMGSSK